MRVNFKKVYPIERKISPKNKTKTKKKRSGRNKPEPKTGNKYRPHRFPNDLLQSKQHVSQQNVKNSQITKE